MKRSLFLVLLCAGLMAVPAAAQQPPPAPAPPASDRSARPLTAGQIQQLFDGWVLEQAQDALQLSDAQYGPFVTHLKALQDVRRRHQIARNRILAQLRQLTNPQKGVADDALVAAQLKALREEDDRASGDIRRAFDGVDETLDTRQQARFRLFEERMEQRKLELLMRARQNPRAAARGRKE